MNTKGQYMKESNTLADNASNISLGRKILINTKGQYMKESNTLAENASKISLGRENLIDKFGISLFTLISYILELFQPYTAISWTNHLYLRLKS